MLIFKQSFSSKLLTLLLVTVLVISTIKVSAFAAIPAVEANVRVTQDGSSPFDGVTYDPTSNSNGGLDANGSNGIVRISDFITYFFDVSVNDTDNTNVMVTATLDQGSSQLQNWTTLPEICKIDAPFTPISSISTDKRTLNCNIGNHKQGSKLGFSALAGVNTRAKSKDLVNVAITAKGDLGLVSTPFKSKDTIVTGNFSIDLDKSVPSDRSKPEYPGNYAVPSQKGPIGEDGRLINYTIVLNTAKGSEGILPDTGKT